MRNSFRFWMQDSTGETTPPDTQPLFGPRLRAFPASCLGRLLTFLDKLPSLSVAQPPMRPLQVSDFPRQVMEEQLKILHADRKELRAKERAVRARADLLNAAIQYACSPQCHGSSIWLDAWNEGDESADDELRAWMGSGDGKAVLGTAVVGRDGMFRVPPAVGCERPEPAPVQPAPGSVAPFTYKGEPPAVPVHPAPISVFRQTPEQRSICSHRVTRNFDNVETCNWPHAAIARCSGCPLLKR